ncbi:MAG: hypothetical protein KGL18_05185 [Burkholderiales bacterium]|nr:hypothetical protein [Burkholderiales bacterium]MDE1929880.1 hypothetical protein [Burkholderiales bacterium]MDE2161230.1 hypothetical protein [Burkholderiales bacterium]MDE2502354.1 hypothetical protein [Burkholderiales bacterium]
MSANTTLWWTLLCCASAINVVAWVASALALRRRQASVHPATRDAMRMQMALSAVYVLGCAYRSVFPVFDIRRLCLFDSQLSSVIVGRSVATVAELCFAAQWALLLRGVARSASSAPALAVSRLVLPLIALAELCSWYAVLTTDNIGHVFEETIWGLAAALLVASLAFVWPHCRRELRPALALCGVAGLAYVAYMFGVDVPMYWSRWIHDLGVGRPFLTLSQGVADASGRWIVSHHWRDWRSEVTWMTLYFTVAVWLSISLMHAPRLWAAERSRIVARPRDRAAPTRGQEFAS